MTFFKSEKKPLSLLMLAEGQLLIIKELDDLKKRHNALLAYLKLEDVSVERVIRPKE